MGFLDELESGARRVCRMRLALDAASEQDEEEDDGRTLVEHIEEALDGSFSHASIARLLIERGLDDTAPRTLAAHVRAHRTGECSCG